MWTKDLLLNDEAKNRIEKNRKTGRKNASKKLHVKAVERMNKNFKWGKDLVKNNYVKSKYSNALICALLYWGEGAKTTNRVEFTNSDPDMIRMFITTMCEGFGVNRSLLRANLHLHDYHNERKQLNYWIKISELKEENFNKTYWKHNSGNNIRKGYQGCIRICFNSKETVDKIKSVYQELSKLI